MSYNNSHIDTHFAETVKIGKGRFIRTNFKKKKKEKLRKIAVQKKREKIGKKQERKEENR